MSKTYDVQSALLAEHFLQDHPHRNPGDTAALALAIQDAIEAFMCDMDARVERPQGEKT